MARLAIVVDLPSSGRVEVARIVWTGLSGLANCMLVRRARYASAAADFGANLLGAMIGGVCEYLSLLAGYRFLLIVVAALYGLAFLSSRVLGRFAPRAL